MYYVLFDKIMKGADAANETVLEKDVQEFVIKTLDRYTYKEFLKVPF